MNLLWQSSREPIATLVLAHGAGAGMTHRHMQALADAFERKAIATLRFNFPFIDAGKNRVDSPAVATASIAAAFAAAEERSATPIWLGGHSFGGRMASHAVLTEPIEPAGLILCSFPLHNPGKTATVRAQHLASIRQPLLFLSGTRDKLAEPALLEPLIKSLPRAKLHWLDTADHGYQVLKRTRRSVDGVYDEMARVAHEFIAAFHSRAGHVTIPATGPQQP
jgi:predicted alpha/beta-hydrolase family hydrolase